MGAGVREQGHKTEKGDNGRQWGAFEEGRSIKSQRTEAEMLALLWHQRRAGTETEPSVSQRVQGLVSGSASSSLEMGY
jgi:hypothetical protein